jgi:adsorption protein B
MDWGGPILTSLDLVVREAALFAAAGFLLLGIGDLLVDLIWLRLRAAASTHRRAVLGDVPPPARPGLLAVFVPAWDEAAVIGPMLRGALSAWGEADYRLYVGCYANDPATIAAVRAVADPRVRLVIGSPAGPTTKADCLNRIWCALTADEAADGRLAKAIVLHDAEDVVHRDELRLFDSLIERFDLVQTPVVPMIHPQSRWIGAHYADEFAEAHGKELPVREWIAAALPSAGVGCAFSRSVLQRIAGRAGGVPFDAASLTEDYELGLRVREAGGVSTFAAIAPAAGEPPVATREYFPGTLAAAVAQKGRWMAGIALSGWDRMGWSGGAGERWMRLRDRRAVLAAVFLLSGYAAAALWLLLAPLRLALGHRSEPFPPLLDALIAINLGLLAWRMAMRFGFTARLYGWREGLRAMPRAAVANLVAILAAASALSRYCAARRTGETRWGKTAHIFPSALAGE